MTARPRAETPLQLVDASEDGLTRQGLWGLLWLQRLELGAAANRGGRWDGVVHEPVLSLAMGIADGDDELLLVTEGRDCPRVYRRAREIVGELVAAKKFTEVDT